MNLIFLFYMYIPLLLTLLFAVTVVLEMMLSVLYWFCSGSGSDSVMLPGSLERLCFCAFLSFLHKRYAQSHTQTSDTYFLVKQRYIYIKRFITMRDEHFPS